MKRFGIFATVVLSLLDSFSLAQNQQSKPFALVLISENKSINGSALFACHEGAAIEGLCTGGPLKGSDASTTFHLNTTKNEFVANKTAGKTGVLTWELQNIGVSSQLPPLRSIKLSLVC
jgi:hypothetical protein